MPGAMYVRVAVLRLVREAEPGEVEDGHEIILFQVGARPSGIHVVEVGRAPAPDEDHELRVSWGHVPRVVHAGGDHDVAARAELMRLLAEQDRSLSAQDDRVLGVRVPVEVEVRARREAGEVRGPVVVRVQAQLERACVGALRTRPGGSERRVLPVDDARLLRVLGGQVSRGECAREEQGCRCHEGKPGGSGGELHECCSIHGACLSGVSQWSGAARRLDGEPVTPAFPL